MRTSRRVRVRVGGTVLADSTRSRTLIGSGQPVRRYLPRDDVRTDLLAPSHTTTRCPCKGIAHHWSLRLDDRLEKAVRAHPQAPADRNAED